MTQLDKVALHVFIIANLGDLASAYDYFEIWLKIWGERVDLFDSVIGVRVGSIRDGIGGIVVGVGAGISGGRIIVGVGAGAVRIIAELSEEAGGEAVITATKREARTGIGEEEAFASASHANVGKAAFLFEFGFGVVAKAGKEAFF